MKTKSKYLLQQIIQNEKGYSKYEINDKSDFYIHKNIGGQHNFLKHPPTRERMNYSMRNINNNLEKQNIHVIKKKGRVGGKSNFFQSIKYVIN